MRLGLVRRGGLGAGVALVALLVGVVVGNAAPVGATHLEFVQLGHQNTADNLTSIDNNSLGGAGTGLSVQASTEESTLDQHGLYAVGHDEGQGVFGIADGTGYGVRGSHLGSGGIGVGGHGHFGVFGDGFVGVYGVGEATGVYGNGDVGVHGESTSGTALRVDGVATFSRSGLAIAGAGQTAKGVTGVSLTTASLVLTTIQGNNTANIYVTRVVTQPSISKFIIYFNQAVPAGTTLKFAWFVLN